MEAAKILKEVERDLNEWAEQRPRANRVLFYCSRCTFVDYSTGRRKPSKCLRCGATTMLRYDEKFNERRRQLAESAKRALEPAIEIVAKASGMLGGKPSWRVEDGRIEFELDRYTSFKYHFLNNSVHIYFFYCDTPQHKETADYLVSELRRLFRGQLVTYPPHTNPHTRPEGAKFELFAYVVEF